MSQTQNIKTLIIILLIFAFKSSTCLHLNDSFYRMIKNKFNFSPLKEVIIYIFVSSQVIFSKENNKVDPQTTSQPAIEVTASPEELMEVAGFVISQQSGMSRIDLTDEEIEAFIKGLKAGIRGQSPSPEKMEILPQNVARTHFFSLLEI